MSKTIEDESILESETVDELRRALCAVNEACDRVITEHRGLATAKARTEAAELGRAVTVTALYDLLTRLQRKPKP